MQDLAFLLPLHNYETTFQGLGAKIAIEIVYLRSSYQYKAKSMPRRLESSALKKKPN